MSLPDVSLRFDSDAPLSSFFDVEAASLPDPETRPGPVEALVAARGETVILVRCLTPAYDDYDSLDPAASVWDLRLVKAIVSSPSEKEARDLAGRGITATKRATLGEYLRLRPDREGHGDLIIEIPDATAIGVSGSGAAWSILVALPDIPGSAEYTVDFSGETPTITGLDRGEYRIYRVQDVNRSRHPIVGVTKLSAYLQEAVGR
ncbi:MAG: hypothetical protein WC129_04895 [Sphaerochaetaceae bacterium]